ncbi:MULTISPECIES: glycoside hydrolase family 5 protein [Flavobacterium]|uniref:mannan endo-1,4-beta-mannosidase n=1 Tax=Flavobacterium jumunjinense TaxID=998845 RepID=A0ABV5GLV9_9FLAO|nr:MULTISPECIES: glycoside hydrolase family 5 protein [Flavobacterium]
MSLINNKNIYRTILIVSFIGLNILLLLGISRILEYLNSGADRSTMLHLEKETVSTYLPKVNWISLENPAREMEKNTLNKIERDYLFAWYIKNNAFQNNDSTGIDDFYTQNTRINLKSTIVYNKQNNISIESTTLKHNPKLEFYSEDGQQIVFTDKNVIEFQKVFKNEKLIATVQDTATYKVLMLLEDGFWRVRHLLKMDKEDFDSIPKKSKGIYSVSGKKIMKDSVDFLVKGINYYPKNSAWDTFGVKFNTDTISKDFDIIKSANLNTIRVFLQYEDFGKADVSIEKLEKLEILLDLAEKKELAVIVTLFDFYGDYSLNSWTLTHRHAEKIVSHFKDHKAILAWDIKNEPNLDFESRGKENVINWLSQTINVVKENDPNHLITIGWSNSESAMNLEDEIDFVSYHFYNPIEQFQQEFTALDKATEKPVVLQEFGLESYKGFWNWFGNNVNDQANYHKKMQDTFKKNNLAFVSWTLYDFPNVPNAVVGRWPWQKQKQKKFGFIDVNGKPKEAFKYISN